ncbi:LuxR C-terminal-related transcriptional regulator [Amycolatopsis rhabdoformis]|uniref:LuxR C-terminal-related transcriptional regulator n=1 Tax=Amycolatopsis rhabdoformis TaxID=1448059 RepID=A0ABZ1IIY5_9PSEU|nr:LuxR C-terminal-related transcriptional regulator [Amycolatopsis rhabdoformis]WSE33761.1 LuxR C-terminal-related transcriptional regulator [Amycolatopsis rhabdoformis]
MPTDARCLICGAAVPATGTQGGRRARFCSGACRQRAYRRRVRARRPGAGCVGRAAELATLRRLLTRHRLVTITGPGGIGKTRLAAELTSAIFVDLSTVDPLPPDPGDLLVLDSCDLRPDAATLITRLLRDHPGLRIVATGRAALGLDGEQLLPLRGLSPADAARLLIGELHLLDPGFAVTAADLTELCRLLEGVPAALVLAAPRVRLLGPAGARHGLTTALDLAPGKRSVRADLERDHGRLDEAEHEAWQRLSVLPGPFDAELAAALGAGPDVLARLVAASLLVPEPAADGTTGLRLWASARAFGRERLDAAGGTEAAFDLLAGYLVAQVEPHLAEFLLPDELCRRLVARAEPVLATIDRLTARGDARLAVAACGLARSWLALGRNVAESEQLLRAALPHVEDRPDLTASLLAALCKAAHRTGRYAEQLRLGERALELESSLDRPARVASILDLLAAGLRASGRDREAGEHYRRALTIARDLADPAVLSLLLNDLAWAALERGDLVAAGEVLAEGLPLARAHATPGRLASVLHTAGALALAAGDHPTAEARFVEALLVTNPTDGLKVPYFAEGVAIVLTARGDHERALGLFACAESGRRGLGAVAEPAWRRRVQAAITTATTALDPRRAHAAARAGARVSPAAAVAYALDASEHFAATGQGRLTPQEHTVAALVTDGLTNQQIARRLGIAPRTVATHLERIRAKLGVRPRSALAAWFTRTTADS